MMDQRVDQRAGPVAGAGMDDQPGRLVDDDQLGILVEDVERDRLALRARPAPARACATATRSPAASLRLGFGDRRAADADRALPDQRLHAAARKIARRALRRATGRGAAPAASGPAASTINPASRFAIRGAHRVRIRKFHMARPALDDETRKSRSTRPSSGAQEAGPLRRDQSRPAVRRPYGGGRRRLSTSPAARRRSAPIGAGRRPAEADIPCRPAPASSRSRFSGNRIAIDAELADGSRAIFLYDLAEQRIVGRFTISPE